jgi:hypothetical protein
MPASVFYFYKIVTRTKLMIYKMSIYYAASVYFLVISEKSSTFAAEIKTNFAYENSATKSIGPNGFIRVMVHEYRLYVYCMWTR